jgi:hypothetical protein
VPIFTGWNLEDDSIRIFCFPEQIFRLGKCQNRIDDPKNLHSTLDQALGKTRDVEKPVETTINWELYVSWKLSYKIWMCEITSRLFLCCIN